MELAAKIASNPFKTEKKRKYIFPLFIMVGAVGLASPLRRLSANR